MKTKCNITGKIQKDEKGNVFCQNVLLPHAAIHYVGYTCTINEISNNLKEDTPEYPYFCIRPSSIDVQIPATITRDENGNLLAGKYRLPDNQGVVEGTQITILEVHPLFDKGAEIWGTVLQYGIDKQKEENREDTFPEEKKTKKGPSINDFGFVLEAGYKDLYALLGKAMKYYDSDPEQSCKNYRSLLKLTVDEAERITNCSSRGGLKKKIDDLCSYLSERGLINELIERELRVVKRLGDKYVHGEDYPDLNPKKDRYTFYCAFQEIFKWLVTLPDNYAAFISAREKERTRLNAEKERLAREAKEREEAEKKALEELKKQEEAERKRLERNAKAQEKRRLEREAKEKELRLAAQKAEEEARAAEKEAKKQIRKIRWQKRVETAKKILPWIGYGTATIIGGIAAGIGLSAIDDAITKQKNNNSLHHKW